MTVDGKIFENIAIIKLSRNPESKEVLNVLMKAGYTIVKREDTENNIIDYIVAKEKLRPNDRGFFPTNNFQQKKLSNYITYDSQCKSLPLP